MQRRRCSHNGVEFEYRLTDRGAGRPVLLTLNGLGTTHLIWAPLVRTLREHYDIALWDYPGLGWSKTEAVDRVDVAQLADRAAAILDDLGTERSHLVGWSLGVQVGFEFARHRSFRVASLIGLCGLAGKPFDGLAGGPIGAVVPEAVAWISERAEGMDRLRGILGKIEGPSRWAKRLGLIDPAVDDLLFDAVIREFVAMDPTVYNQYLQAAAAHDAHDVAAAARFPVLLVGGERDRFVSAARLARLAQTVPGAELFMVRGGTHFLALEHSDLVGLKMHDFIEKRTTA